MNDRTRTLGVFDMNCRLQRSRPRLALALLGMLAALTIAPTLVSAAAPLKAVTIEGITEYRFDNSFIRREDLASEMTVVRSEFEMGENSPERVLSQRMMAVAYEWHNYGKSTIGNRSDIERVPIERLQAFYRKHYQPDNVVLVVGGKFEENTALDLIGKSFGQIPRPKRELDKTYTEEPAQDGERSVMLRRIGKT